MTQTHSVEIRAYLRVNGILTDDELTALTAKIRLALAWYDTRVQVDVEMKEL